jgi:hypothetical protein
MSPDDSEADAGVGATETTVLLSESYYASSRTPLPKAQLSVLYLAKLVIPVAATQFLPYVNHLVLRFGITEDPRRVGFYSGLIVSSITELCVVTFMLIPSCRRAWLRQLKY